VNSISGDGYALSRREYFNSIVGFAALLEPGQALAGLVGTGERRPTAAGENLSPEQAELVECLLGEDPDAPDGPLQTALSNSRLLPAGTASALPFLATASNQMCP
jgi:hypothetical protein